MKSYLSLIPISAKVHRRQSRMTRICIILAVFLVTAIFSMLEMWMEGQTTAMRHNHGNWHIALQNVPEICGFYCATANPTEVIVMETELGRGILGVIDGFSPKGVEDEDGIAWRKGFLRKIGYKF